MNKYLISAFLYGSFRKMFQLQNACHYERETYNTDTRKTETKSLPVPVTDKLVAVGLHGLVAISLAPVFLVMDIRDLEIYIRGLPSDLSASREKFRYFNELIF